MCTNYIYNLFDFIDELKLQCMTPIAHPQFVYRFFLLEFRKNVHATNVCTRWCAIVYVRKHEHTHTHALEMMENSKLC